MTETQVGFLFNAASSLQKAGHNKTLKFLRSYYLMRCKDLTKGYGLPEKHFSAKVRCSKCCTEWNKETETKVKALKLNKKQRRRIRSQKVNKGNKALVEKRKDLLNSNLIEQVCSFCKLTTVTSAQKPEKFKEVRTQTTKAACSNTTNIIQSMNKNNTSNARKTEKAIVKKAEGKKTKMTKNKVANVYSVTQDVFTLNNKKNVLSSAKKEEPKVIKNNKKKKDKFAGLCQKAVLASAKMKQQTEKQNKLNLFLKPSS